MAPAVTQTLAPAVVVGLLAERSRLRAFAAIVLGARTVEEVAATADLDVPTAFRATERLAGGGLIAPDLVDTSSRTHYVVCADRLQATSREHGRARPAPQRLPGDDVLTEDRRATLQNFVVDGRLATIPSSRAKRLVVLDYLSGRFAPGQTYPEAVVNATLARVHPDVAALRRYLVDEGFLERRDGFYWRSGGTFEID